MFSCCVLLLLRVIKYKISYGGRCIKCFLQRWATTYLCLSVVEVLNRKKQRIKTTPFGPALTDYNIKKRTLTDWMNVVIVIDIRTTCIRCTLNAWNSDTRKSNFPYTPVITLNYIKIVTTGWILAKTFVWAKNVIPCIYYSDIHNLEDIELCLSQFAWGPYYTKESKLE